MGLLLPRQRGMGRLKTKTGGWIILTTPFSLLPTILQLNLEVFTELVNLKIFGI